MPSIIFRRPTGGGGLGVRTGSGISTRIGRGPDVATFNRAGRGIRTSGGGATATRLLFSGGVSPPTIGAATVTVEIAFPNRPADTTLTWTDVSAYATDIQIRRGRQYELDRIDAGTCSVTFDNADRRFDPTYTAGAYYPNVTPMKRLRVSATVGGSRHYLFTGFVERWPPEWEGTDSSQVTAAASDGFAVLANAAISGDFVQETSGARIAKVLQAGQWPSSVPAEGSYWRLDVSRLDTSTVLGFPVADTVLDSGASQVGAVTFVDGDGQRALDHILDVADSELGVFFMDGQARAVFHDRNHRLGAAVAATFTDGATSSTSVNYSELRPSYDVDRVFNEIKATALRSEGTTQTQADQGSIDKYFRRTLDRSSQLPTDDEAANLAGYLLMLTKEPHLRFDSVTLDAFYDTDTLTQAVTREISDKVTVQKTPRTHPVAAAQTISQQCFIEAVEHKITPNLIWQTTYQLSPSVSLPAFWTMDSSTLDNTTLLAW